MGGRDKYDALHKQQRLKNEPVGQQLLSFRTDLKFFGRNTERPKAHAAVDHRHFGQQSSLTMPDHEHLFQPGIFSLRVNLRDSFDQRVAQKHRRIRNGTSRVVNKEPELVSIKERGIIAYFVRHLSPPRGAGRGSMHEHDRDMPKAIRTEHEKSIPDILSE